MDWRQRLRRLVSALLTLLLTLLLHLRWLRCFRKPTPPPAPSVFITGAGTGIGRSTALLLNSRGFNVFAGVISESEGAALKKDAEHSEQITPIVCDVTLSESLSRAAAIVSKATGGKLWGLVNNAGIAIADGPVEFVPLDRVRKVFEVNVMGVYNTCQAFLPLVRAAQGRVVNIASINGFFTWMDHTPYCVSKHGVEALTDGLRIEMQPFGVFVSVVEPGGIRTPIWTSAVENVKACQEAMGQNYYKTYGRKNLDAVAEQVEEMYQRSSDPIVIARAIHHALNSPFPKMRYTVGKGAFLLNLFKRCLCTDGVFHVLVASLIRSTRVRPQESAKRM